jgi:hypothetical protein
VEEKKEGKDILVDFLSKCLEDLDYIVEKRPELLEKEFYSYAREAWEEVRYKIKQTLDKLNSLEEDQGLMSGLDAVGLSGNQLKFKNAGFQRVHQEFEDTLRTGKPLGPILRKLFAWFNIILGSFAKALPLLEPVKEFKEALEQSIAREE